MEKMMSGNNVINSWKECKEIDKEKNPTLQLTIVDGEESNILEKKIEEDRKGLIEPVFEVSKEGSDTTQLRVNYFNYDVNKSDLVGLMTANAVSNGQSTFRFPGEDINNTLYKFLDRNSTQENKVKGMLKIVMEKLQNNLLRCWQKNLVGRMVTVDYFK